MGVNDDDLSARERDVMRELVTGNMRRMREARARRLQMGSGAAAVVLVAVVVIGVVLGASRGSEQVANPVKTVTSTPTPTPDVAPRPTEPPEPEPVGAVIPFGGDCGNAISIDRLTEWTGSQMRAVPARWAAPEVSVSGGLMCTWVVPNAYMWGYLEIFAFPLSLFDSQESAPPTSADCDAERCSAGAIVDDMWIAAKWTGALDGGEGAALRSIGASELTELFGVLEENAEAYPRPRQAEPTASWWSASGCERVETGVSSLTRRDDGNDRAEGLIDRPGRAVNLALAGVDGCTWTTPNGDDLVMTIVPGGGDFFDRIAQVEGAEELQVDGSDAAVLLANYFVWEYNGYDLVVRSGDNLLIVGNMPVGLTEEMVAELVDVAAAALAALNAQLA